MSAEPRSILVTGASSGIGRATVQRLVAAGDRVFAGFHDLGSADPALAADPTGRIVGLQLDVTDGGQIDAAVEASTELARGRLDGVVHAAGIPVGGALEEVEAGELRDIFEINVIAPVLLTGKLLPLLRRAGGRVVIVGSLGGRVAVPFAGPYHATKYALEALADSLRLELRPQGVGVALVEPSAISTPIWSKAIAQIERQRSRLEGESRRLYGERLGAFEEKLRSADRNGDPPEKVADKVLEALDGDGARYPVGRGAGSVAHLRALLPDPVFDRLVGTRLG